MLDTPPEARFDGFARLAAHLVGAPIGLVSLVDADRQWFKAAAGLDLRETPRSTSFCAHAILAPDEVMVVEDARLDPRFTDNPLVTGPPHIRFYAGAPIINQHGHALGTLCVVDHEPRQMPPAASRALADIAQGVAAAIELRTSLDSAQSAALRDPLTGLGNRPLFEQSLMAAITLARGPAQHGFAVFCLDLDRFKAVNDLLGHAGGDALLREAARRLVGCVRADDTVARLGGDEFAVILSGPVTHAEAEALAVRLIEALSAPFEYQGQPVPIRTSVGYALAPADGLDADALLRRADNALYSAKNQGRGRQMRFDPAMEGQLASRQSLERDLRAALAQGTFRFEWQPVADTVTGEVTSCEALLRWDRPGFGPVSPTIFVPIAEACGLGGMLDEWVLREGCRQAAAWPYPLKVALNVSASRFHLGGLAGLVSSMLRDSGLAPDRLELEVTEGTLIKDEAAAAVTIEELHVLGVRVALDDFGTGYSSLGYLHALPLDKVKLDRSFIRDIDGSERARSVIRAVLQLCRGLGIKACAEGVETQSQLDFLRIEGCDLVQGYLIGRPNPNPPLPQGSSPSGTTWTLAPRPAIAADPAGAATAPPRPAARTPPRALPPQRWGLGIRRRWASFAVLAMLPMLAFSAWLFETETHDRILTAETEAATAAARGAREVEALVSQARTLLTALARVPEVSGTFDAGEAGRVDAPAGARACRAVLQPIAATAPWQRSLSVIRTDGTLICHSGDSPGTASADVPQFHRVLQTGTEVLSDLVPAGPDEPPMLHLLVPVLGQDGQVAAVLGAGLDPDWLRGLLIAAAPRDFRIAVIDGTGRLVALHVPGAGPERAAGWRPGVDVSTHPAARAALSSPGPGLLRAPMLEGITGIFAHAPVGRTSLRVILGVDEEALLAPVRQRRLLSYLLLGLGGLAVLGIILGLGEVMVLRPIRRLGRTVDRLADGDLSARVGLDRRVATPELAALAQRLDHMAARLAAALETARAASAVKSRFLSAASHELRTPLNGILGWAQLLLRDRSLGPDHREQVRTIVEAGEHLAGVVGRLLEISTIEAGRAEAPRLEAADAAALARSCIDLLRPGADQKGLALRIEVAADVPRAVLLDRARVRQVLLNLLGNAVKFTDHGGVTLRLSKPLEGRLRFEVTDTGPGVSPMLNGRLFQDFVRYDPRGTGAAGSGLGLAVSARFAALLGGQIEYEAGPGGHGSVFWFELPAAVASEPAGAAVPAPILAPVSGMTPPAAPLVLPLRGTVVNATAVPNTAVPDAAMAVAPAPWADGRRLRILAADDVAANRLLLRATLEAVGHSVELVADGAAAVEAVSREAAGFDAVLMDVQMPGMDGLEATRRIRALPGPIGRVPILAVTAGAFREDIAACHEAGMDGHVEKPIRVATLEKALAQIIGANPAGGEASSPRESEAVLERRASA
ncbi:EAL domain-containing protein [Falsiroseomonas sp. E2-1-a4]|uniref:EAL domain-containing protein n=1 Tax=Falsiroseomonas sp. E2-1-a4 TaxID=3239299 RepID=UPI003F2C344B